MKTLSLKISLSILVGILAVICMTAGVVLAGFSSANLIPSVPVSKISSQVWKEASMTNQVTESSQLTGGTLFISATNNKTAIDIPCVMRVSTTFTSVNVDSTKWVKQSNGWYYYVGIVGGGHTGDYNTTTDTAVQFCTAYTAGSNPHITVELMQYSTSTTGGFIKEWSPSAGSSQTLLNNNYTVDGKEFKYQTNGVASFTKFLVIKNDTHKSIFPASDTSNLDKVPFRSMKIINGALKFDSSTTDVTSYLSNYDWSGLTLYNNYNIPMIYYYTLTIASRNTTTNSWSPKMTVSADGWTSVTDNETSNSTKKFIYPSAILPGQYVNFATTINGFGNSTDIDVKLTLTVTAIDVDTFVNSFSETPYATALGTNLTSLAPFVNWVTKMQAYTNTTNLGEFPTPSYSDKTTGNV